MLYKSLYNILNSNILVKGLAPFGEELEGQMLNLAQILEFQMFNFRSPTISDLVNGSFFLFSNVEIPEMLTPYRGY